MRVSVVVPVYNKGPFLEECFNSIFNQTYADFEVIAVDDKSTDDSLERLRAMRDERLRVVALERNLGPSGAAQRAIDLSRGEYIIRVDADDIMLPERFAKQVAFMDERPRLIASGCHLRLFGEEEELWPYPIGEDRCRAELLFSNPVAQGASILRASLLREHNLRYDDHWPRIGEDWFYWAILSRFGEFDNLDEALVLYRRGPQNSNAGVDRVSYRETIIRGLYPLLGLPLSDEDVIHHLMALRSFKERPNAERLRRMRAWLEHMSAMNRERHLFPQAAFDDRLALCWGNLFFALVPYGRGLALRHWLMGPQRPPGRLLYLLKHMVNSLLARRVGS